MRRELLGHRVRPPVVWAAFGLLVVSVLLAIRTRTAWWIVPAGLVLPDLAFLAAVGAGPVEAGRMPARVVPVYNALHRGATPVLVAGVLAVAWESWGWLVLGVAWLSHIVWDRGVGYTLRRPVG